MIALHYILLGLGLGLFIGILPMYTVYLISNTKNKEYIKQIMKGN